MLQTAEKGRWLIGIEPHVRKAVHQPVDRQHHLLLGNIHSQAAVRPEAEAHVMRTTRLFEAAGRHFNRGQRAFFFALGYLGWFVSPWVLLATTALVVIVTWRRQFASNAWRAMGS